MAVAAKRETAPFERRGFAPHAKSERLETFFAAVATILGGSARSRPRPR
jgi:hypothetical protein